MTIEIKNLKYDVLKKVLENPDISELEADLVIQCCIHIISGNRTRELIQGVFEKSSRRIEEINKLNIIKYNIKEIELLLKT